MIKPRSVDRGSKDRSKIYNHSSPAVGSKGGQEIDPQTRAKKGAAKCKSKVTSTGVSSEARGTTTRSPCTRQDAGEAPTQVFLFEKRERENKTSKKKNELDIVRR